MLRFGEDLAGIPIIDLSTGRRLAVTTDILINPNELSVAALVCPVRARNEDCFLLPGNIHEFSNQAISIQNEEALGRQEDIIALEQLIRINYQLIGKRVRTEHKHRLGVVTGYVVDDLSFNIIKLYVRPPITKLLKTSDLIIARSQIVELNDKEVVVRDALAGKRQVASFAVDA